TPRRLTAKSRSEDRPLQSRQPPHRRRPMKTPPEVYRSIMAESWAEQERLNRYEAMMEELVAQEERRIRTHAAMRDGEAYAAAEEAEREEQEDKVGEAAKSSTGVLGTYTKDAAAEIFTWDRPRRPYRRVTSNGTLLKLVVNNKGRRRKARRRGKLFC